MLLPELAPGVDEISSFGGGSAGYSPAKGDLNRCEGRLDGAKAPIGTDACSDMGWY